MALTENVLKAKFNCVELDEEEKYFCSDLKDMVAISSVQVQKVNFPDLHFIQLQQYTTFNYLFAPLF